MVNLRVVQKCQTAMVIPFLLVFLTILVDLTTAQQLPDMPGPPYPDRWGNNRWGVKYDPRVHGRGRPSHHQSSSESSPGPWGGTRNNNFQHQQHRPVEDEPVRYRGGSSSSSSPSSSRGKWGPGLKPIVSSLKKYRDIYRNKRQRASSSSFNPTSDSFNRDSYTSKSIDRYVKNYMNHYNNVAQIPSAPSDLVSIQNFARPIDLSRNFRSSDRRSSRGHTSLHTPNSRYSESEPTSRSNKAVYRTYNPQPDFLGGQNRKTSTIQRNFAKTLSNIYNDYQPGAENTHSFDSERIRSSSAGSSVAASDAISNSIIVADDEVHSYPPSPSLRPRPSAVRGSSYSSSGGKPPSRRRRPSSSSGGSRRPLSALDLYENTQAGYSPGAGPSAGYSESSGGISYSGPSGGGSYSSGSPLSSYSFSGPPTSSSYSGPPSMSSYSPSSPFDPYSSGPATLSHPVSSFDSYGQVPAAPVPQYMPSPDSYFPAPTHQPKRKSKHKKSILQHTPMNVLRGLLGRDRERGRDREYKKAYANLPHLSSASVYDGPQIPARPPPQVPQYSYNPLANTIANGLDFFGGPRQPGFGAPGQPPYGRPPSKSPFPFSFNGKPRPQGHPGPRLPPKSIIDLLDSDVNGGQEKGTKEPYKTHYSQWPQIFTAVGSGVDAVAGGVHAIRKEISKMTGEAMAKGLIMGGTAVHEVSKGMASMISKMATI